MTAIPRKILIVDDDPSTRDGVARLLEAEGFQVAHASDGAAGMEQLREGLRPDAILLDVMMPVMDGRQMHEALQTDPELAAIPIILITGATRDSIPLEVEAIVPKPFNFERLLRVVRDVSPTEKGLCRILVVEDEPAIRDATAELLRQYGYSVLEAGDGAEAIEHLETGWVPDIVLTDLLMPRVNGWELVERLKQQPEWVDIPVVVATAASPTLAGAMQVDGLLPKPIDQRRLVAFVNKALARKRRRIARASPAPVEPAAGTTTGRPTSLPAGPAANAPSQQPPGADARARFFAAVAHELRGPLQVLGFATHVLSSSESLGPKEKRHALAAQSSAARMTRLVEDLVDFIQADQTGLFNVRKQHCDLVEICRGTVDELSAAHPTRAIQLAFPDRLPGVWDPGRMAQVVTNLLQNAIKYGAPETPIDVTLEGDGTSAVLQVKNRGEPIPEAALTTLFDPFKRAVAADDARPGIGLGLAIVKQIAFAHGGAIDVESNAQATTFSVVLPTA